MRCKKQIRSPVIIHKILLDGSVSISEFNFNVTKNQMYYFVLKDCNKRFISDYSNDKMFISLKISSVINGSYLGEEEDDHWMIIPLLVIMGMWLLFSNKDFLK